MSTSISIPMTSMESYETGNNLVGSTGPLRSARRDPLVHGDKNRLEKVLQNWDKIFVISCLVAIFLDPLFVLLLSVQKDKKCIAINWPWTKAIVFFRSLTDFVYFLNILLKCRRAYVAPEPIWWGKTNLRGRGCFFVDVFLVLPLPQRVKKCLRDACHNTGFGGQCLRFIDCGDGYARNNGNGTNPNWESWTKNVNATACFSGDSFEYGIYKPAVNLTSKNYITRYVFSLFWGFQQISTLAGNQEPSDSVWEVLFTMLIIGVGLLLFAFLIGNMQNFLQALDRRRQEFLLRQRDVKQWMSYRDLPKELKKRVRAAEKYNWKATRGVNEGSLIENLPEDIQKDIRRHMFKSVKKVLISSLMDQHILVDQHILDAICERLKQARYIKGSEILYPGGVVNKMIFIVRGNLESIGDDRTVTPLREGSVCGEELLTWFLEHTSVSKDGKKIKVTGQRLHSNRTVRCLTNVETFSLQAADLEEVIDHLASLKKTERSPPQDPK